MKKETRRYPLDRERSRAIVRELMAADEWFADPWEPLVGGMITAQVGRFACPLQVSWMQEHDGTDVTAQVDAPLTGRGRADYFGIRDRALKRFFESLDAAVARALAASSGQ